ncbi:MAG: RNA polymerase sigma factor, partial [Acidimicrobiia bacterium]
MTGPRPGAGSSLSDGELLRDSSRDSRAFALFYSRHVDAVLAWCYQRTGDAETAADLAMEVFAEAFVTRRRYRADTSTARPWLLGIARNQLGRL